MAANQSEPATEIVLAAPAGLLVRRTSAAQLADGPFRSAAAADETTIITFEPGAKPTASYSPLLIIPLFFATILAIIAGLAAQHGHYIIAALAFAPFVLFVSLLTIGDQPKPVAAPETPELTITRADLVLPDGTRLALDQVRRIKVLAEPEAHEVRITTPTGDRVAARTAPRPHAQYIADEIERAYQAFLRRGRA